MEPAAKVYSSIYLEILHARHCRINRMTGRSAHGLVSLIRSLGDSPRQCMDPVDHVYGVLGMLQIKIPRMSDPKAIWQCFLTELDDCLKEIIERRFIDHVQNFDLTKAKTIGDVYSVLWSHLSNSVIDDIQF